MSGEAAIGAGGRATIGGGAGAGGGAGFAGSGGDFGSEPFVAGSATSPDSPRPTIVIFIFGGDPLGAVEGAAFGDCTENVCPHFGHRIFKPCGGTRRSSTWYGA